MADRISIFTKILIAASCCLCTAYASVTIKIPTGIRTIDSIISGAGGINKTGDGTLILNNAQEFTGPSVVSAGQLLVNGSIPGGVTVNTGMLGGTGTITGSVTNNSTVRTGETAGDFLTIVTDYVQSNGASFLAKASPLVFDYLAVTGAATLDAGAALTVFVTPGVYDSISGVTYQILQATGGITGTFATPVNINAALAPVTLTAALRSGGQHYDLTIKGISQTFNGGTVTSTQLAAVTGPVTFGTSTTFSDSATIPNFITFDNSSISTTPGQTTIFSGTAASASDSTTRVDGGGVVKFTGDASQNHGIFYVGASGGDGDNTTLSLNGGQWGPLQTWVNKGSTLTGSADILGDLVVFGTHNPHSSIINQSVGGNYTLSPGSTLQLEFNSSAASSVVVAGSVQLDGTLQLMPEARTVTVENEAGTTVVPVPTSFQLSQGLHTYSIITTGDTTNGIQGEFAHLSVPDVNTIDYSLSYTDDYNLLMVNLQVLSTVVFKNDGSGNIKANDVAIGYKTIPVGYTNSNPKAEIITMDHHNATEAADSALSAVSSAISGGQTASSNISTTSDSFRQLNLASMGRAPHKDRLHAVLHALQENGPISFEQNQHRIWFSPYTNMGRTDAAADQAGNHRWTVGSLAGYEYRNVARKRLIGLILGGSTGLQTVTGTPGSWTRSKGLNTGVYAGTDLFEHARIESVVLWIHSALKKQRSGTDPIKGAYYAVSKFKQDTIVADLSASYRFQINNNWSVRPNIGNTYFMTTTDKAVEINTPSPIATSANKSHTSQYYGGIGARYSWEASKIVYRLTSVFEVGREYYKKGSPLKSTTSHSSTNIPPQVLSTNGMTKKTITKYFTINGALLDDENGLKQVLCYSGQFTNGSRTHSFMLKTEKRF